MQHRIIRSWYTGHWWVGCYIWYSEREPERAAAPPSPLLAVPNITAHPPTSSVPIIVSLYDGPLLCGFTVAVKGLNSPIISCSGARLAPRELDIKIQRQTNNVDKDSYTERWREMSGRSRREFIVVCIHQHESDNFYWSKMVEMNTREQQVTEIINLTR